MLTMVALASGANAQSLTPGPPGPFVFDLRGATSNMPSDVALFPGLSTDATVPARGFGGSVGGHFYRVQDWAGAPRFWCRRTHGAWLDGGRELLADVCGPSDLDELWNCERMEHAERRGRRHTHQRRSWRSVGECALFQLGWWRALVHQPALRRRLRSPHSPPCGRGSPAEANGDFDCGWYVAEVKVGAGDGDRTGDIELGKLAFYR